MGRPRGSTLSFTTASQPPPAAPTGFGAAPASPTRIDLAWTDASNDETSFEVERSSSAAFTAPTALSASAGATSLGDSGLLPNATYHYRIRSRRGASASGWVTAAPRTTPAAAPGAATGAAGDVGQSSATISGDVNPTGSATEYWFEYGTTQALGSATAAADAGSGRDTVGRSAALTGLEPETTYWFRVVARNAGGTTAGTPATFTSAAAPVQQPDPPQQPNQPQQPQNDDTQPPAPPAPGPGPVPDPPKDVKPPRTALTIPAQTLSTALSRGVSFKLKVNEPGRASTRALVAPSALGRRSRQVELVVGRSTKQMTKAGTFTVRIKLSSTARRLLKRRKTVKLWIETTVTDTAGNRTKPVRSAVVLRAKPAAARR